MLGIGTHCDTGPTDMVTEHLRYFDHYLTGTTVIQLALESSTPDVNGCAYLETVDAKRKVEIISHGRLKASARKISDPPYDNLGLPWHSN